MKIKYIFVLISLFIFLSCKKENVACTSLFAILDVGVEYSNGNIVALDSISVSMKTTNEIILSEKLNPAHSDGRYYIFTDNYINHLSIGNADTIVFHGFKNNLQLVNENYVLTRDACHFSLVNGKAKIIVD